MEQLALKARGNNVQKKGIPEKRALKPRQDRSLEAKAVDQLLQMPAFTTLLRGVQAKKSTDMIAGSGIDVTGAELSKGAGLKKGVGRVLAEGPMQHDLALGALRTLSPNASPLYRTNKVGESLTLAGGNALKDAAIDLAVGKYLPKVPGMKNLGEEVVEKITKAVPYANFATDQKFYEQLMGLAGYLQKTRPELDGKSIYQSIPGFEDYLTDLAKKNIAGKSSVKNSKLLTSVNEHLGTKPFDDEAGLALMKLIAPDYAPPVESDNEGRMMPKFDQYQYKPAMQGDYYTEELGLTEKQEKGWDILKLLKAYEFHKDDLAKTAPMQYISELFQDLSLKNAIKVNNKYLGPSPSPKNMSQMGSQGINTRTTPQLP